MPDYDEILLSLEARHADKILHGTKTVELRTRRMRLRPNSLAWIYAKHPTAAVVGRVEVLQVLALAPQELWNTFGAKTGISYAEFNGYFGQREIGFGLLLGTVVRAREPVSLSSLRGIDRRFRPPQFFKRLNSDCADLTDALREAIW